MNAVLLAGRILFGGYFIYKGIHHFMRPGIVTTSPGTGSVVFPAIEGGMAGLTFLLSGLCIVCGIYPFVGLLWTGPVAVRDEVVRVDISTVRNRIFSLQENNAKGTP